MLAVAVGLSFGLCYGLANHNTYLLYPLRELDPEFLRYDWLAAQTTAYHRNFALLIELLALLGPAPWTVAGANAAMVAALMLTIYGFLNRHYRRDALVAILLLMCFVLLEKTRSVASSHILTSILEPSSVAASAVVIGLLLLLAERYLWSGVLVAIGGFFHTNFLLLDFIFFGLVHLAFGRAQIARRLWLQLGPSVAVLLFEFPMLYAMATDPLGGEARNIFQLIRSPHHYFPRTYLADFIPFAGWHLLAMSCLDLKILRSADLLPAGEGLCGVSRPRHDRHGADHAVLCPLCFTAILLAHGAVFGLAGPARNRHSDRTLFQRERGTRDRQGF